MNLKRAILATLLPATMVLASLACSAPAAAPAPTKAPDKPAAAPTSAPASQPTAAQPAAAPAAPTSAPAAAQPAATSGGEIKIGFNCPVTGASAAQGAYQTKALKLAVKQINDAGGINGKKINVITQDNQSTNPGALAALNKSIEQDKVIGVVGPVKSTQILAMSDAVKAAGVPWIIGGTNVTITQAGNPWIFRVRPADDIAAAAIVKYIKEDLKLTKVGILHDTDAFGTGGADLVEQGSKAAGMTMVRRESYTTKDKDFTAQLLAMKSAGAEVMVMYAPNPEDAAVAERQYRQLGSPFKWIGTPSTVERDALNLAKESAEGLLGVTDWVPGQSDVAAKYGEAYKKEYNEEFDPTSAWTYDGLNILASAIKKGGEDRAKIKDALFATQGYKGVLGSFSFTPQGDGIHEVSVIQVENANHKLMKVVNVGNK